ncbi:MAG: hypothetical protein M3347_10705, partial [Armatimonadota bacterium]|nr:hypothetical protein [Armatimonadota bacterium]
MNFQNCIFIFCSILWSATTALAAHPYLPPHNRLPEKPAWEIDLTEKLTLTDGTQYADMMSRAARASRVRGAALKWSVTIQVPAERLVWPVVLEGDETRVLRDVTVDGAKSSFDRRETGDLWFSGEGSLLLPLLPQQTTCAVAFTEIDNPQAYENGFGRLRLRPATMNEVLRFNRDENSGRVTAVNLSNRPLAVSVRVLQEDFFTAPLGDVTQTFSLAPNAETLVALPKPDGADELYKTRVWGEASGRKTYEYQTIQDGTRLIRTRPIVARLKNSWERVFIPGPPSENPPPATGWAAPGAKIEASSHWMWARQSFTIPAEFPVGQRVQLVLPSGISHHARVLLDGQLLGEAYGWELPRTFTLPATATPGSTHTLQLGITDYIVGIAPGANVPKSGPWTPGARSMAAPIGTTGPANIGVGTTPELVPVPDVHLENTVIRTKVVGDKTLEAAMQVVNDSANTVQHSVRMRVFECGQPVFDLGTTPANVAAGASQSITLQKAWPDAKLWNLENPHLYELRTEILDAAGKVLDVRRDRFGFREFGIKGGYFTLNGAVLKLHGGSHVYPNAYMWPARPSPYRIMRHQAFAISGVAGGGQTQGIIGANTADEMGYLLKAGVGNTNAHGADNYAWQLPQTFARLYDATVANARAYINNPSIVMWDMANEIQFKGPGEADKMGEVFRNVRAFDPTRFVTVGGSNPLVTGAEVVNYHGWGDWENRIDYFFYHPEERPSYLRNAGYFQHRPDHEPSPPWIADLKNGGGATELYPGYARALRHIDNHPVMFAEGVYMESINTFPLFG